MQGCTARDSVMVVRSVTVLATSDSNKILNISSSGCIGKNDCVRVIHSKYSHAVSTVK